MSFQITKRHAVESQQSMAAQLARVSNHPLQRRIDDSPRQWQQAAQLSQLQQRQQTPQQVAVQRKKTDEERSAKHRRMARASETIAKLGGSLNPGLSNHIFHALPIAGGELKKDDPSGLHAYTNGALPDTITEVSHRGSPGGVHTLTWHAAGGGKNKDSTMFPVWMPPAHVATLIALKYPAVQQAAADEPLYREEAKTHIQHGQDIYSRIKKVGHTVYPQ